jgi:hypothetical protein
MAGLVVPAIGSGTLLVGMAGTSPAMTMKREECPGTDPVVSRQIIRIEIDCLISV